jgi:hypothetical protein
MTSDIDCIHDTVKLPAGLLSPVRLHIFKAMTMTSTHSLTKV